MDYKKAKHGRILTFEEVRRLKIFPFVVGYEEIKRFFSLNYPPDLACGFTQNEIEAFEKQARADFDIPNTRQAPIAMILIPGSVLNIIGETVPLSLGKVLSTFCLTLAYAQNKKCEEGQIRKEIDEFLQKKVDEEGKKFEKELNEVRLVPVTIMTYFLPNPVYLGKEYTAQVRLVESREEEVLTFAEAVFCHLMIKCLAEEIWEWKIEENFNLPRLCRMPRSITRKYFGDFIVFDFDKSFCGLYFRPLQQKENLLVYSGKITI